MSTYFDDHMSTSLYTSELICLDLPMIIYPDIEMLCLFTCLIDHVLTYLLALMIIFSHVYLLSWSYVSRFTYFDVHLLLHSHALIITHPFMLTCFDNHMPHVYILWWEHFHLLRCLNAHMPEHFLIACSYVHMHCWSHASMFTCLDDSMLPCLHTLRITCPLACMPSNSYAWTHWWLPTPMLKCFVCSHALLIMCSHMYLLWR